MGEKNQFDYLLYDRLWTCFHYAFQLWTSDANQDGDNDGEGENN